MRKRRTLFVAMVLVLALIVSVGCGQRAADTPAVGPIKIGILMPLTGDLGFLGGAMADSGKLAVKQINEAGGILGQQVEVIIADTQTDPVAAREAMDKLVNVDRVAIVVGAAGSTNSFAALEVAMAGQVAMISPSSTSPRFTTHDDGGYFHRTAPSDALQGAVMAQLAYNDGHRKAATLALNNDYGQAFIEVFVESFRARGGEVVEQVLYDPQGTTFTSEVNRIGASGADVVILVGYPETGAAILREAYQQGALDKMEFLLSEGLQDNELANLVGKDASGKFIIEGLRGTAPMATGPLRDSFFAAFAAEYGQEPAGPFDAHTYDAAIIALLAVEKAGSTNGPAVRDAIRQVSSPPGTQTSDIAEALRMIRAGQDVDFDGASGTLNMSEVGDVLSDYELWTIDAEGKVSRIGQVTPE